MSADGNPRPFLIRVGIVVLAAAALLGWMLHSGTQRVRDHAGVTTRTVPQDMVGVWTSTRDGVVRCIEMAEDGTWTMVPNVEAGDRFAAENGTWRVVDQDILWRNASGVFDKNRLIAATDGHFNTLEADRSQTKFDRILAGPAARCPK
jgi:hypothetical protein